MTNKVWVAVQSAISVLFVTVSAATVAQLLTVEVDRFANSSIVSCLWARLVI